MAWSASSSSISITDSPHQVLVNNLKPNSGPQHQKIRSSNTKIQEKSGVAMVSTVGSTNTGTGSTSSGDLGAKDVSVVPTNNNLNSNWSKIQALKQRKSELEKLLNEKKSLLQQIQRQEAQIFGTSNEIQNSNRDTNDSNIKTNSSNLNKPVNSQCATDDINRNSLTSAGNGSLRRKIGTSFKIPKNFTYNNNNISEQQFEGDVEKLMLEKRFHQNVCNALYKLVNDPNLSKSIRRTHRNEYDVAQQKLIAINHNLSLIKKQHGQQQRPIKSNTLHTTSPSTNSGFIRSISPSFVQGSIAPGVSMPVSLSNYNIQTGNLLKPPSASSVYTLQHHHNHNSNIVNNNNNNNTTISSTSTNSSNNLNTINFDQCNNNTKINCTISKNQTESLLNGISIGNNNNNLINGMRYGHNYLIKERRNSIKSLPNHESSKLHSDDVSDISLSIVYPMQQASFNDFNSEHHQAVIDQNSTVIDNNLSVSHNIANNNDQLQCETSPNTFDGITGQRFANNSNIVPATATFLNPLLQQTNSGDSLNNRQVYNSMAIEPNHIEDINKFYHHQHYHHQQQPQQFYRYLTNPSTADVARSSGIFTLKKSQDLPDHPLEFQTHSYSQQAVGQQSGLGGYWRTLSNNERVWCTVDSSYDNSTIQHAKSKKLNSSLSHSLRSSSVGNFDTISSGRDDMIDKVSISSMNSETNKKPREKQWLETSLDGPIIKAKTSNDSIPSVLSASFSTYKACQNNTPIMVQSPTSYQISATSTLPPTSLSSPVCSAHYNPHGYQIHKHHYSYRDPSTSSSASSTSVQQSHKLNISPLRSKLSSQSMLVSPNHYRSVPITQSHIVKKSPNNDSNLLTHPQSPVDLISITDSPLHLRSNNLDLQSGSDSPAAIFDSTLLKSPIHYHQLSKAPDIRIESPKNMTVVQQAIFMPYKEVTKPFEMSDFYKYSTKFRQKDNINKHQPQIPAGIDENSA